MDTIENIPTLRVKENKYATVIDSDGYRVDFVIVDITEYDDSTKTAIPQSYTLKEGESFIYNDWQTANNMLKARWNGEAWEETATPEEIEAARPPQPEQPEQINIQEFITGLMEGYNG